MEATNLRVAREDLLLFLNACYACTGQREHYGDGYGQRVSLAFLHEYILGNYRRLYARVLACGVNHANQALIVQNLLATGAKLDPADRVEENALLTRALATLPTHRAMHVLEALARRGVNNRRTRALTAAYLAQERELRAIKYRRAYARAARHAHVALGGELPTFFARGWKTLRFETPLLETFRAAHFAEKAIYALPFTVAEGLAAKHGVARATFLTNIAPRMTHHERMRMFEAARAEGVTLPVDWTKQPLTHLCSYVLSLSPLERARRREELEASLMTAAQRLARRTRSRFGAVACVLDASRSSRGSREKENRPLAVALAVAYFFRAAAERATLHWTSAGATDPLMVRARGATDLVTPLLDAYATQPSLIVIVSDGFDNDPQGLAGEVCTAYARLVPTTFVLHLNPVFDHEGLAPKSLSPAVPTLGIREVDDVPTLLAFARFASGDATMAALDAALDARVRAFLEVKS